MRAQRASSGHLYRHVSTRGGVCVIGAPLAPLMPGPGHDKGPSKSDGPELEQRRVAYATAFPPLFPSTSPLSLSLSSCS